MAFPRRNVQRWVCRKLGDTAPAPEESRRAPEKWGGQRGSRVGYAGTTRRADERHREEVARTCQVQGQWRDKLIFRELEKQILQSKNRQRSMARKYVALYPQGENFHIENHTPRD